MTQSLFSLNNYLRTKFGQRIQKIPLDAGFSCPNRDGTISTQGCIFCNPHGSGTNFAKQGLSLTEQYLWWMNKFKKKYKCNLFLAYLQSYSNTYGPLKKIQKVLTEIKKLPNLIGLCLGTRPDCLDKQKLELIQSFNFPEVWLEIGLQSAHDKTLIKINRGHDSKCFAHTVQLVNAYGLKTCAHVIAGLPGETKQDFIYTIKFLNDLPIYGIKFHNIYVCKDTMLAKYWQQGKFNPLSLEEYLEWISEAIQILRPDIVIHRLNGDPAPNELLAPAWAKNKQQILNQLFLRLKNKNVYQGKDYRPSRSEGLDPK